MAYSQQTWTDNVTPVDKVHMDHIESGIVTIDTGGAAAKGAANGYASLDANSKLAVAQVPLTYGTSLPASPVDGQEHVLVNSVTAPDWQWRFRYNAGNTSAYKWEFVGGAAYSLVGGSANITGTTPTVITGSPAFTFPRGGVYNILFGGFAQNNGGFPGAYAAIMQLYLAGASVGAQCIATPTASYDGTSVSHLVAAAVPSAGQGLDMRAWNGSSGPTTSFSQCWFQITPVRLS